MSAQDPTQEEDLVVTVRVAELKQLLYIVQEGQSPNIIYRESDGEFERLRMAYSERGTILRTAALNVRKWLHEI